MLVVKTITGSVYHIDRENNRVRRASNSNGRVATNRQGDNEWKTYAHLSPVEIGRSLVIWWDPNTTPLLPGSLGGAPATETSLVVEICQDDN